MYNGIGLQTARGSGTNGYVQSNKFFVSARNSKVVFDGNKGFGPDQGGMKKPNTEILEHDRKRQIQLKLLILEDDLTEKGFTQSQIALRLDQLRHKLETQAPPIPHTSNLSLSDATISDTQTHQVAARKDKQMERLREAFGFTVSEAELIKQGKRDELEMLRRGDFDNDSEREEGELLSGDEDMKIDKHHQDELKTKHKVSKKKPVNKRKAQHGSLSSGSESVRETSDSESDSDQEKKIKKRSIKISKKVIRGDSSDSGSASDEHYRNRIKVAKRDPKALKRHDSGSESDSSRSSGHRITKSRQHIAKRRHDSDSDNEHNNDRWKSSPTPDRELGPDRNKSKTKGGDYKKKHEAEHQKRSGTSYSDIWIDSGRGTRSEKLVRERHNDNELERIEEDEYRGKKRERREENEERDVKRERREEDKDGGRRREKRDEEKQGGRPRELREEDAQNVEKLGAREEDKDGGRRGEKMDRTKETKDGDVKHERRDRDKDGGRREKMMEKELGGRREMKDGDATHARQERKEESKNTGRKEKREKDEHVGRIRETGERYANQAWKSEMKGEDEHFNKRWERQGKDEERITKRERIDEDEHGSRNQEKRGREKSKDERKEKDGLDRKTREGKEDEYGRRRSGHKESSRRHLSDDVRKRH